jgi:hypothetical protein
MAHLNAKQCALVSGGTQYAMESLSKTALIDLVFDMLRRADGADAAEEWLLGRLTDYYLPAVCRERGQKVPNLAGKFRKWHRLADEYRAKHGISDAVAPARGDDR